MKKTLLILFTTMQLIVLGQIPTPTDYYPFTGGSIAGLTQNGAALATTLDRANSASDAISLNGDYLTRGAFNTNSLSVSYWIKTETVDGNARAIINQTSGNKGWFTYLQNGLVGFGASYEHGQQVNGSMQQYYTGYSYIMGTTNVADGYWHNVIVTASKSIYFDGAGYVKSFVYTIHIDGVQENTVTVLRGSSGSFTNVYADLCWNIPVSVAMNVANKYQDGIDDIRFYSSVVDAAGITALSSENSCPHPENVTFTSTSVTSTIVNWDASYDAATWDLTYVESGQPIGNGTTISGISSTSQFLSGLTNNTSYDIYLTSNCSSFSSWVSPATTFTTLCESSGTTAQTNDITIQLDATGNKSITASDINNNSVTSCGVAATISIDISTFNCSNIGSNTVTLTASDNLGNSSTATATVTVLPAAVAQDINAYLDASGNVTVNANDIDNGSNAICSSSFTASLDISTFNCSNLGTNNVVLSISDGNGNVGTASAVITVLDTLAPTVITQDITLSLDANYETTIISSMINNGSTDNCSGVLTYSLSKTSFNCENQGANTVELTVTDAQGNSAVGTAIVTINQVYQDVSVSALQTQFCDNASASTTITTGSSNVGVDYYLRDQNNAIIDGPIAGTGSALNLSTGTITGNTTYNVYAEKQTAVTNQFALDFDGINDVVHTNLTMPTTSTFTIESWIFPRSTNYDRFLSNYLGNFAGQFAIDSYNPTDNGKGLRAYIVGPSNVAFNVTVANVLTSNAWNHIAVTFNSGALKLYVNGIQVGSGQAPFTSFPTNASTISFGDDPNIGTPEYFNGKMDDVRFWTVARTASEIMDNQNNCLLGNESGLIAFYNLEDGSGTTATDLVGGKNGVLTQMDGATDWISSAYSCVSACSFEMSQTVTVSVSQSQNLSETVSICSGSDYTFPDGTTQTNITAQVVYTSNLQTVGSNCDSIVETTVNINPVYNLSETVAICSGSDYTFPDGTTQTNITSQVVYNSNLLTVGSNCDSIVETTVNINPIYNLSETVAVCSGSDYTFPDGTTQTNITAQIVYTSNLQTTNSCDSIIETTVNVNPVYNLSETVAVCSGSDYTFPDGTTQTNITAQIVYTSNLQTTNSCDSIIETTVNVNPVYNLSETVAVCSGSDYTFPDGTTQTNIAAQVVYTSNLQTVTLCDSIIVTTVDVNPSYNLSENISICSGSDYTFPDGTTQTNITAQVIYTSSFQTTLNCDSLIVTTVDVNPTYNLSQNISICSGSDYTFPDGTTQMNITSQLVYTSSLQTVNLCDSIIVTTVDVNPVFNLTENATICSGSDYTFPDGTTQSNITTQVIYTSNLQTVNACDSTITTTIFVITLDNSVSVNGNVISSNHSAVNYQWIDCNNNDTPIANETNQSFTPIISGSYACLVDDGTCTVKTECTVINLVQLGQLQNSNFMIYPNPATSTLTIETDSKIVEILIFNVAGELVQKETENNFSVENLVKGVYLINIKTKGGIIRSKFVKS